VNLSPTTHSPSPLYGVQSLHENLDSTATNQRFFAFVIEPSRNLDFGSHVLSSSHRVHLPSGFRSEQYFFQRQKDPEQGNLIDLSESRRSRWQLLKKFEGSVVSVTAETFTAHFKDNRSDAAFIEAEIDLSKLQEEDRALAVEGASLVWTISFCWQGGTKKRESSIYFRHLPAWSAEEIAKAQDQIKRISDAVQWE
jgi:hypothetical protein